jgi:hypothetical protein
MSNESQNTSVTIRELSADETEAVTGAAKVVIDPKAPGTVTIGKDGTVTYNPKG